MRVSEGDFVKWMLPLDNDYSYGRINSIRNAIALVTHIGGYYDGKQVEVHLKYIQKGESKSGGKATVGIAGVDLGAAGYADMGTSYAFVLHQ